MLLITLTSVPVRCDSDAVVSSGIDGRDGKDSRVNDLYD